MWRKVLVCANEKRFSSYVIDRASLHFHKVLVSLSFVNKNIYISLAQIEIEFLKLSLEVRVLA